MRKKGLLYEISTRSWIKQFGETATLQDVPPAYWDNLIEQGFEYVWLMGIWKTNVSSIERYCFHPNLTAHYDRVAEEWQREDVWGSPYAIEDYVVHERVGTEIELLLLKQKLNQRGLKLILDFVPNHFNAHSGLVNEHPNIFLKGSEADLQNDPSTYYTQGGQIFAHGRDPHFPAWTDTVQVDYYNPDTHAFMTQKLHDIAVLCDGVRCDMSMLMLPDIFHQTWQRGASQPRDFWQSAIAELKADKEFVFIAEAYWDREAQLQELGFDYCYDKALLDLLLSENHDGLHHHLARGNGWFSGAITFLENHDEERSLSSLGFEKSRSAAVLASTLPGIHLFFDGQFAGARHRVPVQLALDASEQKCVCIQAQEEGCYCQKVFYKSLLDALQHPAFMGDWVMVESGHHQVYAWVWSKGNEKCLVCTNYGHDFLRIHLSVSFQVWKDLLNDEKQPNYLSQDGDRLTIDLPPFRAVILI